MAHDEDTEYTEEEIEVVIEEPEEEEMIEVEVEVDGKIEVKNLKLLFCYWFNY